MEHMINDIRDYWDRWYQRYPTSGAGSRGGELAFKVEQIKKECKDVHSILDIGCGDFKLGKQVCDMFAPAEYAGFDISESILKINREAYPEYEFNKIEDYSSILGKKADLVLCIDVLFHQLDDMEYDRLLNLLPTLYNKYLVISEYDDTTLGNKWHYVRNRHFDPTTIGDNFVAIRIPYESTHKWFYIFRK
jgi:hypothetical protein